MVVITMLLMIKLGCAYDGACVECNYQLIAIVSVLHSVTLSVLL